MRTSDHVSSLDLLEQEIPHLRRFACYLVRDADYADDLVQECLVRAVDHIGQWRPGSNMRAWLFVILRNVVRNDLRKAKREVGASEFNENGLGLSITPGQATQAALLDVKRGFLALNRNHRDIFLLLAVSGLTYREASRVLDVPIGTVRSRLSRARDALREIVGEPKARVRKPSAARGRRWDRSRSGRPETGIDPRSSEAA